MTLAQRYILDKALALAAKQIANIRGMIKMEKHTERDVYKAIRDLMIMTRSTAKTFRETFPDAVKEEER